MIRNFRHKELKRLFENDEAKLIRPNWHGYYAMTVSGNWRIIFRFENGDARDVDLIDYH